MTEAIRSLFEMLVQKEKSGSDYLATVTRTEGKTAYVQFNGSDITDTPVALSIGAKQGDTVRVRVADGRAWLVGNDTAPPNDSSEVASGLQLTNDVVANTNVKLETLSVNYAEFNTVVTNELVAHQAVIDELDATYANIALANIDTANINTAKIKDLFVQVGLIQNAVIDGARITGYLDAVEVNAASITAGTLVADRIAIRGSTTSLVYALNNYGQITSTQVNTLDGYVLTDRTINASKIVANSITATEITTQNLVGTNGWINLSAGTFNFGVGRLTWNGTTLAVGGWEVTTNQIRKYTQADSSGISYRVSMNASSSISDPTTAAFVVEKLENDTHDSYPFLIRYNGGIVATMGTLGGWTIDSSAIATPDTVASGTYNGYEKIRLNSAGSILCYGPEVFTAIMDGLVNVRGGSGSLQLAAPNSSSDTPMLNILNSTTQARLRAKASSLVLTADRNDSTAASFEYDSTSAQLNLNKSTITVTGDNKPISANNSNNNVDIRASSTNAGLYHGSGSGSSTAKWLIYIDSSGTVRSNATSDRRSKDVIGELPMSETLSVLRGVDIVNFTYKEDTGKTVQNGIVAQQLRDVLIESGVGYRSYMNIFRTGTEETLTDLTAPEDDVNYGLDYSKFTPILWRGWQYLDKRVKELEQQIKEMGGTI